MPNRPGFGPTPKQGHQGEQPTLQEVVPGISRWRWPDGTELRTDEVQALGLKNPTDPEFWGDTMGHELGFNPTTAGANAPGASLDVSAADAQRQQTEDFIAALQQQAATGSGSWERTFAEGVQRSKDAALALGSSQPGTDYGSALRGVNAAQTSAQQQSVADADMLREQSKLDAQRQLGGILGSQAGMDIGQSAEASRIVRERNLANQAMIDQSRKNREGTEKAIAGTFTGGALKMSKGGEVPGEPKVFGNDTANDTVPAKLSPDEIVLPLSVTLAPDAPERAAEFVRAVQAQGRGHSGNFADGGSAGTDKYGGNDLNMGHAQDLGSEGMAGYFIEPHIGRGMQYKKMHELYANDPAANLNTSQIRQTTGQQDALSALFAGQAIGSGPSIVPMLNQKAANETMGSAHAAGQRWAPQSAVLGAAAASGTDAAAEAARRKAIEQSEGQSALSGALLSRRGQELQLASAQQRAAWEKTLADMGLSMEQQASLRGSIAAAGQGAAAFASAGRGRGDDRGGGGDEVGDTSFAQDTDLGGGDMDMGGGGDEVGDTRSAETHDDPGFAEGGKVENAAERYARKQREYDEEGDGEVYRPKTKVSSDRTMAELRAQAKKEGAAWALDRVPDESKASDDSAFARALRAAGKFAKNAAGAVGRYAEGGPVYQGYDPSMFLPPDVSYTPENPLPALPPGPTCAELGLGGGFSPDAQVSFQKPADTPIPAQLPRVPAAQPVLARNESGAIEERQGVMLPEIPGLKLKQEPAAQAPAPAVVKPKPAGTGAPAFGSKADAASREAAQAGYEAQVAQGKAVIDAAAAEASALESQVNERKAVAARVQERMQAAQSRFAQAQEDMSRIDTSVDPGRFWNSRTTGDKVMGIIGLVMGALGAGPDGINRAAVMLNQAVDRDLEAQKAEHELRLKKGAAKVDAARSFYAMAREAGGDELSAMDLAHAAALQSVAAKGKTLLAKTGNLQAKAQLQQLLAGVEQGAAQRAAAGWEKAQDRALEREKIEASKSRAAGPGAADAVKTIAEVTEREANIQKNARELDALIEQYGTQEKLAPGIEARMNQLRSALIVDSAKLKDPAGVVREPDEEREGRSLGFEPGFWQRSSNARAAIKSFAAGAEQRKHEALKARGLTP